MYTDKIEIKGKSHNIKFNNWVMRQLEGEGYITNDIYQNLSNKMYSFFPKVLYYGILNGTEKRESEITQDDVFEWSDNTKGGFIGGEGHRLLTLFQKSSTDFVRQLEGKELEKALAKTPATKKK